MTIKGLTDDIREGYGRLGRLRKGGEKTAKGFGEDLDHFRFTSDKPEVAEAFHQVYGNAPRLVRIYIPHVRVHDAFATWCEVWNATGLVHRCDGQTMSLWREGSKFVKGSRPCAGGHKDNDPLKDAVGRLEFVVPELIQAGHVGYITLETHSKNDILNISRVLEAVHKSHGDLRGVEFALRRVKENISAPGWGERKNDRTRVDKWLVRIEPSVDWVRLQLEAARQSAMMIAGPTATVIDGETGEITERPALPAPSNGNGHSGDASEEEKFFGKPPEDKAPPASNAGTKKAQPAKQPTNGAAKKKAPLTWSPDERVVDTEFTRGEFETFCQRIGATADDLKEAFGDKGLVTEWMADPKATWRNPDKAAMTLLETVWDRLWKFAKANGWQGDSIPGDAPRSVYIERIAELHESLHALAETENA